MGESLQAETEVARDTAAPADAPHGPHTFGRPDVAVFLFLAVLTILWTYPIGLHMTDQVIGHDDDNFQSLYGLWYIAHSWFDVHSMSPLVDPAVYVPYGFDFVRNQDLSPATLLLFVPLTRAIGEVAAYNVAILLAFFLTAWGTYLLALELWGSREGALLAAVIVGFSTYLGSHVVQVNIAATQWIPFFFLFLERTLRRPTPLRAVLVGLFYGMLSLATWYYAFLAPIAAVLYLAVRLRGAAARHVIPITVIAAIVALGLIGPFAIPYLHASRSGIMVARTWEAQQSFSAAISDFLLPSIRHSLWGEWVEETWRSGPHVWITDWQTYIGMVALALAVFSVVRERTRLTWALVCMAVGSLLFAFGPSLYFRHPPAIDGAPDLAPLSFIPMPAKWLGRVPPFTFVRAWSRMAFFVQLAVGLLAARGLALVLERASASYPSRARQLRPALVALAVGLVVLENVSVPFPASDVAQRPIDRWLAQQPGPVTVMEYPIPDHGYSASALYRRRLTGKAITMGYGSYPPNLWAWETLALFPAPTTLDLLRRWRVTHVLVDETLYEKGSEFWGLRQTWTSLQQAIAATPRLKEFAALDGVHVYGLLELDAEPAGAQLLRNSGFEARSGSQLSDWMPKGTGTPWCDRSGAEAHQGTAACRVTNTESLVATQVAISQRQCYQLRVFTRADEANPTGRLRLQIRWLSADGRELGLPSDVVIADQHWSAARADFRAPEGASRADVNAVAYDGIVWVDDYALHEHPDGCQPTLMAVPNPVPIATGGGRALVVWNTGDGSEGDVYVSADGGPEALLSKEHAGREPIASIKPGSQYEVRLYKKGADRSVPLKTLTVTTSGS